MKRITSALVSVIMCCTLLPSTTFATNSSNFDGIEYEITSLKELERVVEKNQDTSSGIIESTIAQQIVNQTDPYIIKLYVDQQTENFKDAIKGQVFNLDNASKSGGDVETKEYDMRTEDATIHVVLEDKPEPYEKKLLTRDGSKDNYSEDAIKQIGDRYFTGSCYYQSGLVTIRIYAENHYTVTSDRTLKERYLTIKEVQGFIYCDNTATQVGSTNTATKIGDSIKYRIQVVSKIGPIPEVGGNITTKYYYANLGVKLLAQQTDGVKVTHSFAWE